MNTRTQKMLIALAGTLSATALLTACGEELDQYGGNNPWPFKVKGRCCSYCDNHFVIPLRGRLMMLQRKNQLAEQQ